MAQTYITPKARPPATSWWADGGTREEWYARAQYEHASRMDAHRSPSWSDAPQSPTAPRITRITHRGGRHKKETL